MKKNGLYFLAVLAFLTACNDNRETNKAENGLDAARTFIRAALDGDYSKAKTMLVNDSLNLQTLEAFERSYKESMSKQDKDEYRSASIHIYETKELNDSTSIIYYSNTYRNKKDSLRVVRIDDKWLVDFKSFIFAHKPDSLP